jgi:hypothetical protein
MLQAEELNHTLARIAAAGIPEAETGYVILGCEWLFRLRDFGPQDAERVLLRIEMRLTNILGANEAWIVTEALAPDIRRLLRRHRQLAAVLEMKPPPAFPFADQLTVTAPAREEGQRYPRRH